MTIECNYLTKHFIKGVQEYLLLHIIVSSWQCCICLIKEEYKKHLYALILTRTQMHLYKILWACTHWLTKMMYYMYGFSNMAFLRSFAWLYWSNYTRVYSAKVIFWKMLVFSLKLLHKNSFKSFGIYWKTFLISQLMDFVWNLVKNIIKSFGIWYPRHTFQ